MDATTGPRVVLVHDWLTGMRGGEKCLEVLCREWPRAPLFTLLHQPGLVSQAIENRRIYTSWLQRLPTRAGNYRYFLPLMPAATASWKLPPCDLVMSFSHCVAKAATPPAGVPHVCYCFTPMRYAWHMRDAYFHSARLCGVTRWALDQLLGQLRDWDRRSAGRVTHFVAISRTVQQRIAECYGRSSQVIYPPVDTDFYTPAAVERQDYYLVVSAFAPYKRLDLAIEACGRLGRQLVVIGTGQDQRRLAGLANGRVTFLGWQDNHVIRDHLRRCRALLFPGEEDFGIAPVEAQACGAPVIAYGQGGATESVVPLGAKRDPTGVWFEEQSAESLIEAVLQLEKSLPEFSPRAARRQALRFGTARYHAEIMSYVDDVVRAPAATRRQAA